MLKFVACKCKLFFGPPCRVHEMYKNIHSVLYQSDGLLHKASGTVHTVPCTIKRIWTDGAPSQMFVESTLGAGIGIIFLHTKNISRKKLYKMVMY